MKNSICIIGFCCIALGLASCSKDEEAVVEEVSVNKLQYMEFTADVGSDTRMQLVEGNKVEWQAGDAISVFDGTGNRLFTTKDSGPTAVFTGEAVQTSTYYALYPYQLGATIEGNVLKNVTLPSTQTAKAGSFEAGFNLTVASASAEKMQFDFKNVISLVKFSVSNDRAREVRSVKLTSHDANVVLAGTVDINISDQPTVVLKSEQQSSITLNAPNGLEVGKSYYFSVLPGTLSKGFTLTFANSEGKTWQKSTDASLTTERSNIVNLKSVEIGTFTKALLTNTNLITAAENSTGQMFERNPDGSVSLLNSSNLQIVNAVKILDLSGKNDPTICDEIGVFANLELIDCSGNGIINLDFSNNLKLLSVYCSGNEREGVRSYNMRGFWRSNVNGTLESINVAKNTLLSFLSIPNNQVSTLDISNNKELITLSCFNNNLGSLDVSANNKLKGLSCHGNYLTSLNVSNNKELTFLTCSGGNDIESLDLRNNTKLKTIYCGGNAFTSLDVSNCPDLELLYCDWSLLTEIDLSKNLNLAILNCYNSKIMRLDLSYNSKLLDLHCGSCRLSNLNVSNNLNLESLQCYDNQLTTLDLSNNSNLNYLICFMNQLTTLDISNTKIYLGCGFGNQKDNNGNDLMLTLYVNPEQYNQELGHDDWSWTSPYVDDVNSNVNVLLKSNATHEGFTESNYGDDGENGHNNMQAIISFADNSVKTVCVNNWDTNKDGEVSYAEIASVSNIGTVFKGIRIENFEEFQYFTGITSIPNNAFDGYGSTQTLISIVLPESIVSIGEYAFRQQTSLSTITIPQNVTSLGMQAFAGCAALKTIYFKSATPPTYGSDAIPDVIQRIYVPAGSVDSYKAAFSKFANRIMAGDY